MNNSQFPSLSLFISTDVSFKDHLNSAIHEAIEAQLLSQQGKFIKLIRHLKTALEHSLAASYLVKGESKTQLDSASQSLKEAINFAGLKYLESATISAKVALQELETTKILNKLLCNFNPNYSVSFHKK